MSFPAAEPEAALRKQPPGDPNEVQMTSFSEIQPDNKLVMDYKKRGHNDSSIEGRAYYCAEDLLKNANSTHVGMSYQVSAVSQINSVTETFNIVLDLNLLYQIKDQDRERYEYYRGQGTVDLEDVCEDPEIVIEPPLLDVSNVVSAPEFSGGRILSIQKRYDPRANEWRWYVQWYIQVRAECYEEFEMEEFPFARQSLQVHLTVKQRFGELMLVPFNSRVTLPTWELLENGEVGRVAGRGNAYKMNNNPGNWVKEGHHAFFMPEFMLPENPRGHKHSDMIVSIQYKQSQNFFMYNTLTVIAWLPVLSATCVVQNIQDIALRMSIVLTLLLTMSTYKISVSAWIPQKDYLTKMDMYIIAGFFFILVIAIWVMLASFLVLVDMQPTQMFENALMIVIVVGWICLHIYIWSYDFEAWTTLLKHETKNLKDIAEDAEKENKLMKGVKFMNASRPPAPDAAGTIRETMNKYKLCNGDMAKLAEEHDLDPAKLKKARFKTAFAFAQAVQYEPHNFKR